MATAKLLDRVKMSVSGTPGTGSITFGSAAAKYQSVTGAGGANGDTLSYLIDDFSNWEIGVGTYNANVLSRDTVLASSSAGAKISASSTATVYITVLAQDLQSGTGANQLVRLNASGTIPVSNGGTGLTSLTAGYIPYGNGTGAFSNSANLTFDGSKLKVNSSATFGTVNIQTPSNTDGVYLNLTTAGYTGFNIGIPASSNCQFFQFSDGTNAWTISNSSTDLKFTSASGYVWQSGGLDRLRLTSDGNLGLGVTPSAWGSGTKAVQVTAKAFFSSNGNVYDTGNNCYNDGTGWKYVGSNGATLYEMYNGAHYWFNAATSGTAGSAISFTQAMTLNDAGNLGIGATTPITRIHGNVGTSAATNVITFGTDSGAGQLGVDASGNPIITSYGASAIRFGKQTTNGTISSFTEAFRTDGDLNVVIGTAALATSATNGFLYIPTCAGAPTGAATSYTGRSPLVVDSTNNRLYVRVGSTWKYATLN